MEFGTLIPLYFLGLGCFIVTPIVGFIILAFIRLEDKPLARNILITVLGIASVAFLYPILGLILELIYIPLCCPESANLLTSKALLVMISATLKAGLFPIIPSLTIGFLIAFIVIVPATLVVRSWNDI